MLISLAVAFGAIALPRICVSAPTWGTESILLSLLGSILSTLLSVAPITQGEASASERRDEPCLVDLEPAAV